MKRAIIALFLMCTSVHADNIDKVIDNAISHGAHGKVTRKQMRSYVELGMHYEPRDNSWTNEREYHPISEYRPASEHRQANRHWVYFNNEGSIWIDGVLMYYVRSRGLMEGGHRYIVNGHTVWQVQLVNGQWADVYPQ